MAFLVLGRSSNAKAEAAKSSLLLILVGSCEGTLLTSWAQGVDNLSGGFWDKCEEGECIVCVSGCLNVLLALTYDIHCKASTNVSQSPSLCRTNAVSFTGSEALSGNELILITKRAMLGHFSHTGAECGIVPLIGIRQQ